MSQRMTLDNPSTIQPISNIGPDWACTVSSVKGHLRQRKPGVWELVVDLGRDPATGRRQQQSRTLRGTKREAQQELAAMVTRAVAGMQVGSDATAAELLDKWLDLVADELSPTTLRGYRGVVRGKIVPALGDVKIRKLRPSQIDALYLALVRDEGLAPATVRQVHAVLRRALSQAVKWGWIPANPAVNASPPRIRRPDIRPPDLDEVRKLIAEADVSDPDFATFLRLMVATGLRRGEACALRWNDLDIDGASLLVERAIITVTGKGTAEKDTKTHAARRIALDPGTLDVLLAHHAVVEERARVCAELDPDAFIFSHARLTRVGRGTPTT